MKKRFSRLAVFAALGFCAFAAYAEEAYQTEISAVYFRADWGQDFKSTVIGASAEVLFAPVKVDGHPYAEAAFLERIGSARVTAYDYGAEAGTSEGNGRSVEAGVTYLRPDSSLAFQATYGTSKFDYDAPLSQSNKGNDYSLKIGNYFTRTLLAGVNYANSKTETSRPGLPDSESSTKDYGLFAHYVNELGQGNALSLDGSLSSSTSDDGVESLKNTIASVSFDYFFNRGLSAGLGIENNSGGDRSSEGQTYSANVRYFITPRFSVNAWYDRSSAANAGYDDSKSFMIIMALRF